MGEAPLVASPVGALVYSMPKSTDAPVLSSEKATCPGALVPLGDPCIGRCAVMCAPVVCSSGIGTSYLP